MYLQVPIPITYYCPAAPSQFPNDVRRNRAAPNCNSDILLEDPGFSADLVSGVSVTELISHRSLLCQSLFFCEFHLCW